MSHVDHLNGNKVCICSDLHVICTLPPPRASVLCGRDATLPSKRHERGRKAIPTESIHNWVRVELPCTEEVRFYCVLSVAARWQHKADLFG